MSLQLLHHNFIEKLEKIYPPSEAENIWQIALQKALPTTDIKKRIKDDAVAPSEIELLLAIENRLLKHEPIQYIINECWFYDIPFYVDANVLIPRPETEELVDWIIKENNVNKELVILDIGTGSGCIPIILKRKLPLAKLFSCDISKQALTVEKKNASTYNTDINFINLDFLNTDNFSFLPEGDIIVSNPPYVPDSNKASMRKNVLDYEPHKALFVEDNDPIIFYNRIGEFGLQKLKPGGKIYVEGHEDFAGNIVESFQQKGYKTSVKKDLQGKQRMVKAVLI